MKDSYETQELAAALDAADAGDWGPLETFTQQHDVLSPNRIVTQVYYRADFATMQRVEYHRNIGTLAHWTREVKSLFAGESSIVP